jgi:hypothetical protein
MVSVLDLVRVASPCPVRWETMVGGERVRSCLQCQQQSSTCRRCDGKRRRR